MAIDFSDIPESVIDYVRQVFSAANDKVSRTLETHPSMWEGTLDHVLVMELTASPPAFFAEEQIGLAIESHWLGSRRMWGNWEIADIALFVTLRKRGHPELRKVALLQTKRLYAKEIPTVELDESDYRIGIGRLVDDTGPLTPLSSQRAFTLDEDCVYGALRAAHEQVTRIDEYMRERGIPVYYGLYNPPTLPHEGTYPPTAGSPPQTRNDVGCRIQPASDVHGAVARHTAGQAPTYRDLTLPSPLDPSDGRSNHGWRLERFVADEVLRCREGKRFEGADDLNLEALLYRRSAPITAAISIVIDMGGGDEEARR